MHITCMGIMVTCCCHTCGLVVFSVLPVMHVLSNKNIHSDNEKAS